jgi:hypothetical protein
MLHPVPPVICNDFKPECKETVTEWQLLDPAAPGAPADSYAQSAVAACRIMGYSTFGSGSTHMVGEWGSAAAAGLQPTTLVFFSNEDADPRPQQPLPACLVAHTCTQDQPRTRATMAR